MGRQSLVTPIDWKLTGSAIGPLQFGGSRQSLVTPIDWKRFEDPAIGADRVGSPILGDAY